MKSNRPILSTTIAAVIAITCQHAFAGSFTISNASTTAQTLGTGSGQTGSVTATGSLTVTGATVAVTISGNNATLTNLGTISQTGNGRVIRDNTGVTGLVINNGSATNSSALMQASDADVIQMNKTPAGVTLNNYGTMTSLNASAGGSQAVDFNAILSGTNIVNNFATGIMQASEADAVRPGVNGVVNNSGLIKSVTALGSGSDGIDAQTNTGIIITNAGASTGTGTGTIEGGRHGITGGNVATDSVGNPTVNGGAYAMSITNNLGGTIKGDNGSGVNIDGLNGNEVVTIVNRGTITGNGHSLGDGVAHDGDGVDVDGLVNITNTGTIKSINAYGGAPVGGVQSIEFSEGVTVGGGTITNSGIIQGSVAAGNTTAIGRGITIAGVDKLLTTVGGVVTETSIPAQAPYAATTITNQTGGQIIGDSDSAIIFSSSLASGFSHTITNQTGALIQTGGTTATAILTAADNVTINNAGTIDGSSSGKAIAGGSGNITLNITGGSASVLGNITGGSGTNALIINPGTGNQFSYGGTISSFATTAMQSGRFNFSGSTDGTGVITITGGTFNYTGAGALGNNITVNGGEFKNNGGNLTGTFTLTSGMVSGTNFSGVALNIGAGVTLSPGNSPGTLTSGSQTWAGGGSYLWEINRLAADGGAQGTDPGWDFASIAGALNVTATAGNKFTIDVDALNLLTSWNPYQNYTFTLASASGGITGFDPSEFLIDTSAFADVHSLDGGVFSLSVDGNNLDLNFTAVPEPATFGFGFALLGVAFGRRRRMICSAEKQPR